jgi:hypothetical protein
MDFYKLIYSSKAILFYLSRRAIIIGFIDRIIVLLGNIKVIAILFIY